MAKPEPTKSDSRNVMSLAERHDIFGLSDDSDNSSPSQSRLIDCDRDGCLVQSSDDDGDAVTRHDQDGRAGHGVGTSIDTTQEARDRGILCVDPEKKRGCLLCECGSPFPTR